MKVLRKITLLAIVVAFGLAATQPALAGKKPSPNGYAWGFGTNGFSDGR